MLSLLEKGEFDAVVTDAAGFDTTVRVYVEVWEDDGRIPSFDGTITYNRVKSWKGHFNLPPHVSNVGREFDVTLSDGRSGRFLVSGVDYVAQRVEFVGTGLLA